MLTKPLYDTPILLPPEIAKINTWETIKTIYNSIDN